jgi:1,2-phenylacetyl-CoA epoxidase catalytic subunit
LKNKAECEPGAHADSLCSKSQASNVTSGIHNASCSYDWYFEALDGIHNTRQQCHQPHLSTFSKMQNTSDSVVFNQKHNSWENTDMMTVLVSLAESIGEFQESTAPIDSLCLDKVCAEVLYHEALTPDNVKSNPC